MKKIKEKGFSLVEILIVLSIILIISAASFVLYGYVSDNVSAKKESEFLNVMKIDTISSYLTKNSYSDIDNAHLIAYSVPDKNNIKSEDSIVSPAGYSFIATPYSSGRGFNFKLENVSYDLCIKMLPQISKNFTLINTENSNTLTVKDYPDICNANMLTLTYSDYVSKKIDTGISFSGVQFEKFNPKYSKTDSLGINGQGFSMKVSQASKDGNLLDYIISDLGVKNQFTHNTNIASTGYQQSTCGSFSNSSSCGNITMDSILNSLKDAPDSLKSGATVVLSGGNTAAISSICKSFKCSVGKNENGISVTYLNL